MIDEGSLLQKLRACSIKQPLKQCSRAAQLKMAKLVYSNTSIRDIPAFIREANDIARKTREANKQRQHGGSADEGKLRRYDDNELKELSYQFQSVSAKYLTDKYPRGCHAKASNTANTMSRVIVQMMDNEYRSKPGLLVRDRKKGSFISEKVISPIRHMARLTKFQSLNQPSNTILRSSFKRIESPTKVRASFRPAQQPQTEVIILRQQQLTKGMDRLISLINTPESQNYYIPREQIFGLIEHKYRLRAEQNQPSSPECRKFAVEVPHCQFLHLKSCRQSLGQIFNLPVRAAQKIAFKIYDRNGNGVIDQKDIIQLLLLAEDMSVLQDDLQVIISNYKVSTNKERSWKQAGRGRAQTEGIQDSEVNLSYRSKNTNKEDQSRARQAGVHLFDKSKYFTFKETKEDFLKCADQRPASQIQLTWEDFQACFGSSRPDVFYDLLDYLFGLDCRLIYQNAEKNCKQLPKINQKQSLKELRLSQSKRLISQQKLRQKNQKSSDNRVQQKSIQKMIRQAISIEQFETMKYT